MLRKIKLLSLATASAVVIGSSANALNLSTSGDIKVRDALAVAETQKLNFGTIATPSSTVNVHITKAGVVGGSNSATHIDTSAIQEGVYTISGSALDTISIQAADNGNVAGMEFTTIAGDYSGTVDGDILAGINTQTPPGAGKDLTIGAILQVAGTVTEGDYAPGFTLTVNYD